MKFVDYGKFQFLLGHLVAICLKSCKKVVKGKIKRYYGTFVVERLFLSTIYCKLCFELTGHLCLPDLPSRSRSITEAVVGAKIRNKLLIT